MRFIRIFKAFLAGLTSRKASLASARVASGCISKSASEGSPAGAPREPIFLVFYGVLPTLGTPPKAVPASRRVAFQNLLESRPKGAATLSGCLNVSKNKQLQAKTHSASAQRPSPRQPASHRVAFQILPQTPPSWSPPDAQKHCVLSVFALPGPSKGLPASACISKCPRRALDFRFRGPLPKTGHSTQRK